jgi:hypothetical protein
MFVNHKHKISESRSTMSRGPPRLNLSDPQTVTGLSRFKCICDGFSEMFVNHKHKKSFGNTPLSHLHFSKKLVWHSNFYHTTTTDPQHPKPKKHNRKKPSAKKPPTSPTMPTNHNSTLHSSAQFGNLEYGKARLRRRFFHHLRHYPTTKYKMASILAQTNSFRNKSLHSIRNSAPQ